MKILVTGTAGFIGSHLAIKLLERGDEVVGLDNINDYYDQNVKYGRLQRGGIIESLEDGKSIPYGELLTSTTDANYKFIKLDLEDKDAMMKLFEKEKFDAVCNLAAQAGVRYSLTNPDAYIQSNIVGFINILEACRHHNVDNLSYASSSSVYGLNEELPFSTTHNADHPISLYAASKKSNELMAHTYSHLYNISTTGLRFFTVYGPWGRPDMALFLFTKAALEGNKIDVFNSGEMLRDFTYIDDIVEGVIRVIDNPAKPLSQKSPEELRGSEEESPEQVWGSEEESPEQVWGSEEESPEQVWGSEKRGSGQVRGSEERGSGQVWGSSEMTEPRTSSGQNLPADRSSAPYKVYNIGNNNPVKLMDFITAIENKLGKTIEKNMMPIQPGDVPATYADVQDLVDDLDYKPATPIQEGIDNFVDWYLEFFQVKADDKSVKG